MDHKGETGRGASRDFIRRIIDRDVAEGRYDEIVTRFPPEPNGYLHIGHAKAILLNHGLADEYDGRFHLRYDDTNPLTEDEEYTRSMQEDIRWLGCDWGEHLYYASDYFERMYEVAQGLIRQGKAYVDSASEEEIREARGTVTEPGRPTPDRERTVEDNLDLFARMRAGEFDDGAYVLRGKIDLASPNMLMRDPVFYRIRNAHHYRTGDAWRIYPLYDFAHCLEDAFEGITHSLCTLEFENNRELYDWILDAAGFAEPRNHQYEFARLNLDYTVMSKRKLIRLVREGHVRGWDDPRMPTIAGLRRRGVPPGAIRRFVEMDGVTRVNSSLDPSKLDFAVRDVLNPTAPRAMAVLRPLRVVLTDWPDGHVASLQAPFYPDDDTSPSRPLPMSKGLWIDQDDFALDPPPGWKRLAPGREVRLRHGYVIKCHAVIESPDGGPMTLHCTHDPATLGRTPDRRIGGTIHWVAATGAVPAEFRLYDRLFAVPDPNDVPEDGDFTDHLAPDSLTVLNGWVEPSLVEGVPGVPALTAPAPESRVQFERLGYFTRDPDSTRTAPVFNRIVPLRDTWKKRVTDGFTLGDSVSEARSSTGAGTRHTPPVYQTDQDRIADERTAAREADPELARRFAAYQEERGLSTKQADLLTAERAVSDFYEAAAGAAGSDSDAAAWIVNDLQGLLPDGGVGALPTDGATVGRLIRVVLDGGVSRRAAKDVLAELVRGGGDPLAIIERDGLATMDDEGALRSAVEAALAEWPDKVAAYRAGRTNLIGLFMGQVMKATGGRADPQAVRALLVERLGEGAE